MGLIGLIGLKGLIGLRVVGPIRFIGFRVLLGLRWQESTQKRRQEERRSETLNVEIWGLGFRGPTS